MFDRIIVLRDRPEDKKGAIFIPNEAKEAPNIGTVIAVGEGRLCDTVQNGYHVVDDVYKTTGVFVEPLRLRVGDRVLFQSYAGTEIKNPLTGDTVLVMTEDDVLCTITEPSIPTPIEETPSNADSPEISQEVNNLPEQPAA